MAPVLLILLCWSIYQQVMAQPDLSQQWNYIKSAWLLPAFSLVLVLMVLNWGLETIKWMVLLQPLTKLSFTKAFASVMAGCSITLITPNRMGEFGGRILYLPIEHRIKGISLTILGSMSQLIITLLMGMTGLLWMRLYDQQPVFEHLPNLVSDVLLGLSFICTAGLILLYMNVPWFVKIAVRIKWLKSLVEHVKVLDSFTSKQLLRILLLSFFRYLVFILQYILMLELMHVEVDPMISMRIMMVFFLVMALAPTIGILELPIRASASLELFSVYSTNIVGIQAAAFGIWIINLAIPGIIGSVMVFGTKLFKER